jgi:pre-mRNA-splicing factor RBM22/SLT11
VKSAAPSSAVNREYYAQNRALLNSLLPSDDRYRRTCIEVELTQILLRPLEEAAQGEGEGSSAISFGKADSAGKELLKRLARSDPYYKRNRPHLCTQFAKGSCPRGDACQFRHELPSENGLGKQNILDRYHGRNDPVAHKMLAANAAESGASRAHSLVLGLD